MALRQKQVPISSKNNRAARQAHARASQEFKTYDTSAIKPKRSKTPYIVLAVMLVLVVVGIILVLYNCAAQSSEPTLPEGEQAIVTVAEGESARDVAASLESAGLIGSANDFVKFVKEQDASASIIPGTYVFYGGTSSEEILAALMEGPSSTGDTLTVPEGFTLQNIADALEEATDGRITADEFVAATSDASVYASEFSFLEEAGTNSLEGFLFPKTYTITVTDTATSVVRMMLSQYEADTADLDWSYPKSQGLSRYEALILASIVEKESAAENRATVASVFYNRLASDRPYLESDATTAYEVGHDPTSEEVHADTPYSTYTNAGLPPTPICNPSLEAIEAVCSPEETDYLFFYFDDTGYYFSETYEEHQSTYS